MRRRFQSFIIPIALVLASATAFAGSRSGGFDGRSARAGVVKRYQAEGRSTDIRVSKLKDSRSGKSSQVLVETRSTGKVRAFNVNKETGVARETPTGLLSQAEAKQIANPKLRRQAGTNGRSKGAGTFAGVDSSGLSRSGKSYIETSRTDRNDRVAVDARTGKPRVFKGGNR